MDDIVERLRYQAGVIGSSVVGDPLVASLNRAADEIERLRAEVTPPEGCEAVYLPTEYVDQVAARHGGWIRTLAIACREAQARRTPQVELVPWGKELIGRKVQGEDSPIDYIRSYDRYGSLAGTRWERTASANKMVEVLK